MAAIVVDAAAVLATNSVAGSFLRPFYGNASEYQLIGPEALFD